MAGPSLNSPHPTPPTAAQIAAAVSARKESRNAHAHAQPQAQPPISIASRASSSKASTSSASSSLASRALIRPGVTSQPGSSSSRKSHLASPAPASQPAQAQAQAQPSHGIFSRLFSKPPASSAPALPSTSATGRPTEPVADPRQSSSIASTSYAPASLPNASRTAKLGHPFQINALELAVAPTEPRPNRPTPALQCELQQVYRCPPPAFPLFSVSGLCITFHATDAERSFWPAATQSTTYGPVDDETSRIWRRKCGQAVAEAFNLGDVEQEWYIADWPANYQFTKRYETRAADAPPAVELCMSGSSFIGRRRHWKTIKEFAKHVIWLCRYGDDYSARCECKHCRKIYGSLPVAAGARGRLADLGGTESQTQTPLGSDAPIGTDTGNGNSTGTGAGKPAKREFCSLILRSSNNPAVPAPSKRDLASGRAEAGRDVQSLAKLGSRALAGQAGASTKQCASCGTTQSPEWRRGAAGPKSLCNACGLRYKREQEQEQLRAVRTEASKPAAGQSADPSQPARKDAHAAEGRAGLRNPLTSEGHTGEAVSAARSSQPLTKAPSEQPPPAPVGGPLQSPPFALMAHLVAQGEEDLPDPERFTHTSASAFIPSVPAPADKPDGSASADATTPASAFRPAFPSSSAKVPTAQNLSPKKPGRPFGSTNAAIAARKLKEAAEADPAVLQPASPGIARKPSKKKAVPTTVHGDTDDDYAVGSPAKPVLGKRKRRAGGDRADGDDGDGDDEGVCGEDGDQEPGEGGQPRRSTRPKKQVDYASHYTASGIPLPEYDGPYVHKERAEDLALAYTAPFRVGEVVWVILEEPIRDTKPGSSSTITHWPATVKERNLHVDGTEVRGGAVFRLKVQHGYDHAVKFRYEQTYTYQVLLLGTNQASTEYRRYRQESLLPYSAYIAPTKTLVTEGLRARLVNFDVDPYFDTLTGSLDNAITVYAFALQIAKHMAKCWSVFGQFHDLTKPRLRPQQKRRHKPEVCKRPRKKDVATLAGRQRRQKKIDAEREAADKKVQFYQGLWLGAEKIWAGELVRLSATWTSVMLDPVDTKEGVKEGDAKAVETVAIKLRDGLKGTVLPVPGGQLHPDTVDKPVMFRLAHLYRNPQTQTLMVKGTFVELVERDEKDVEMEANKEQLDADVIGAMPKQEVSKLLHWRYLPDEGNKRYWRTLPGLPANEDFELPMQVLAGRFYRFRSDEYDEQGSIVKRNLKNLRGKATRKVSSYVFASPEVWSVSRDITVNDANTQANDDMAAFFGVRQ